jgi:hypothetical protein
MNSGAVQCSVLTGAHSNLSCYEKTKERSPKAPSSEERVGQHVLYLDSISARGTRVEIFHTLPHYLVQFLHVKGKKKIGGTRG